MATHWQEKPSFYGDQGSSQQSDAQAWNGNPNVPPGHGTYHNPDPVTTPLVPRGTGGSAGTTSVDTPSMLRFADNIEQLLNPCKRAQLGLKNVQVAPGAFFHANQMRSKVSGDGSGGLKDSYLRILDDLTDGLTDLCSGIRLLAKNYDTTEEQNGMAAKDLQEALRNAIAGFGALERDSAAVR